MPETQPVGFARWNAGVYVALLVALLLFMLLVRPAFLRFAEAELAGFPRLSRLPELNILRAGGALFLLFGLFALPAPWLVWRAWRTPRSPDLLGLLLNMALGYVCLTLFGWVMILYAAAFPNLPLGRP